MNIIWHPEAPKMDHGYGNRGILHLDWPRINKRQVKSLQNALQNIDHDAIVLTVFADGLRCLNRGKPHYWRKPLATLDEVLELCAKYGVKTGRGYWLPNGWRCQCPRWSDDPADPKCEIGSDIACMPSDSEKIPATDWFEWAA